MDISSLLSPQETPVVTSSASATPELRRRVSSAAAVARAPGAPPAPSPSSPQQVQHHPRPQRAVASLPLTLTNSSGAQPQQMMPSPPIISPSTVKNPTSTHTTPSVDGRPSGLGRQPSTPGMDTLADLASMQHHQQAARMNANGLRKVDSPQQLSTVQASFPSMQGLSRSRPTTRSSVEFNMPDAIMQTPPPRTFVSASLSQSDLDAIAQIDSHLVKNPYAYASHIQLIRLLHRGLLAHSKCYASQTSKPDPRGYELLEDLRAAREAMAVRFPVGQDLWADWIQDESTLARTIEDRVAVMELCRRAVGEEVGSPKLWLLYANWISSLYGATHPKAPSSVHNAADMDGQDLWTEEERMVGAEIFDWDTVINVWARAATATEWRIHDSHLVWDRYLGILMEELLRAPTPDRVQHVRSLFEERLQVPHATWEATFQTFSTFITAYDDAAYEKTMIATTMRGAPAKVLFEARANFELRIRRAAEMGDEGEEWKAFADYLDWEVARTMGKKKTGGVILCNALYERATLRFANDASLWEDYTFFIVERANRSPNIIPLLPILKRATGHCPWSGTLWSQYLLSCERENQPFHEIEEVKHKATSTGLMDIGGMDEVLKVHTAWCGYLNRRAFHDKATDEEADVAEVGIRSALESVRELGEKKYGQDYKGDPTYRLERIYIEYLSHSGQWERGRKEVWQALAPTRGDSYEFWIRWYQWEMICWSRLFANATTSGAGIEKRTTMATEATAVLRLALKRKDLDWPEKILEVYLHHTEDHESVEELQSATILIRKISRAVAKRRAKESADQASFVQSQQPQASSPEQQQQQQQQQQARDQSETILDQDDDSLNRAKRKRDTDSEVVEGQTSKKARAEETVVEAPSVEPPALKRNRENTTIIVKNLPTEVEATKVRQFFRDCGEILTLRLAPDDDGQSATATIEFAAEEDVLSAQTRDQKSFDGRTIEVCVGTGSTIFVTNFPSTADEAYIRDLFADNEGEIVDVRFPSLKYNTHRRFCYLQFRSSQEAQRAIKKDGQALEGGKLKLVAKISDPRHRQDRSGPLYDGREVYVSNVDWSATQEEITRIFSNYGTIEKVRMPKDLAGRSKGIAFVVFSSKEEATASLALNLTKFRSRILTVAVSTANPVKRQANTIIVAGSQRSSNSPAPDPIPLDPKSLSNGHLPDAIHSVSSPASSHDPATHPSAASIQARTIALLNIPDTINDSRIRVLVSPFGALTKITLRPDHQGAIIEFADPRAAGQAALGVAGTEIMPGRTIYVGTVRELLGAKPEVKPDDRIVIGGGGPKKPPKTGSSSSSLRAMQGAGPIRRPQLGGGRRGGKGGLGFKGGGGGLGGERARTGDGPPLNQDDRRGTTSVEATSPSIATSDLPAPKSEDSKASQKSNADFRALFASTKS